MDVDDNFVNYLFQSEKVWSVRDAMEGFVSKEPISGYTCAKTNTEVGGDRSCIMPKPALFLSLRQASGVVVLKVKGLLI